LRWDKLSMRFDGKQEKREKKLFIHKNWENHERRIKRKNSKEGGGENNRKPCRMANMFGKEEKELYK
jgi:hypothetical protein